MSGVLEFLVGIGSASVTVALLLPRGTIQTAAICDGDYAWASNNLRQTPCLVAAYAQAACNSGSWSVPKLDNSSLGYNFASDACSCSWAVYNLLSACTACQYNGNILSWAAVHTNINCSAYYSTSNYFPLDTPIPGSNIPAWAAMNPSRWTDGIFNAKEAKSIADQGLADLTPTQQDDSNTSVAAIAGGVVGGVLVVLLGTACLVWMIIRRRKSSQSAGTQRPPMHMRSTSDLSQRSMVSAYTSSFGNAVPPSSPARSTAARSVFGSAQGSIFSVSATAPNVQPVSPESRIEPFIVSPTSPRPPLNRKASSDTSIHPVSRPDEGPSEGGRPRFNPPSYTPSVANQAMSVVSRVFQPGHRSGQASQDTQQSWGSGGRSAGPNGGDRSQSVPVHSRQTSADTMNSQADSQVPLA